MFTKEELRELAVQYRQKAAAAEGKAQESFDRCDTDGCVSQFCDQKNAQLYMTLAKICENGGVGERPVLKDGDRTVDAKLIQGQYGLCWILDAEEEKRYDRKFVPHGTRSRIQRELGLHEETELRRIWATLAGHGTGLSGLSTLYVHVYEIKDQEGVQ